MDFSGINIFKRETENDEKSEEGSLKSVKSSYSDKVRLARQMKFLSHSEERRIIPPVPSRCTTPAKSRSPTPVEERIIHSVEERRPFFHFERRGSILSSSSSEVSEPVQEQFIPYKYDINHDKNIVDIFTRSHLGRSWKKFTIPMREWCYLSIPEGIHQPERTTELLKASLNTEKVVYNEDTRCFIVEPSSSINDDVRTISNLITNIEVTPSSVLARHKINFFEPCLDSDDLYGDTEDSVTKDGIIPVNTFKTLVFLIHSTTTFSFSLIDSCFNSTTPIKPNVHLWTTSTEFDETTLKESNNKKDIQTHFRFFENDKDMIDTFTRYVYENIDIFIYFGDETKRNLLGRKIFQTYNKIFQVDRVVMFDLREYTTKLYPTMPDNNLLQCIVQRLETDSSPLIKQCLDTFGNNTALTRGVVFDSKNILFFLEKIISETHLLFHLYGILGPSIFEISKIAGTNFSDILDGKKVAKGIVTSFNPIAAQDNFDETSRIPCDFMPKGFHSTTYVIPLADLMVQNLKKSNDALTKEVGKMSENIKEHGWIIRSLFALKSLRPLEFEYPLLQGMYGIHNSMIYTTQHTKEYEIVRIWDLVINIGLGWIGVQEVENSEDRDFIFGYYGIDEVCKHPFSAMRQAVETYLRLIAVEGSRKITPQTAASTVLLTPETTRILQTVNQYNLKKYRSLLSSLDVQAIEENDAEIDIFLWYASETKLTNNQMKVDTKFYKFLITSSLDRAFSKFSFKRVETHSLPPPPPIEEIIEEVDTVEIIEEKKRTPVRHGMKKLKDKDSLFG